MVTQPAGTMLVTTMQNMLDTIIIGLLAQHTITILTPMLILQMMVGTLMLQLEPTRGLITPIPRLLSPTLLLFTQAEQAEQEVQEVQEEQVVRAERVVQVVRAERVVQAVQVVPEEQVAQAVREQLAKEAEQVAEVLFS
jgi:hypothetical protein